MDNAKRRAGGFASIAKQGRDVVAARARQGNWARCLREVDPDGTMTEAERNQRAEDLQRSKMILLAQRSVEVRRNRKIAQQNAAIRRIAQPPTGCAICGPLPSGTSHITCAPHAQLCVAERNDAPLGTTVQLH